jgi:hypothetical protein
VKIRKLCAKFLSNNAYPQELISKIGHKGGFQKLVSIPAWRPTGVKFLPDAGGSGHKKAQLLDPNSSLFICG